ncbi:hypothetical protein JM18_006110 [Phytophthora kernoviae]|uniref:GAF domain-containing protein n=1 Tax=Phytophthora kernoviae TaxID=325452 RepID=A0A921SDE3_9STRA|nr:hypothetical protein JM18_006110 [Phytophthora kernoviae]
MGLAKRSDDFDPDLDNDKIFKLPSDEKMLQRARDTHMGVDFAALKAGPEQGGPWQRVEVVDRFIVFRHQVTADMDGNQLPGIEVMCAGRLDASLEEVASILRPTGSRACDYSDVSNSDSRGPVKVVDDEPSHSPAPLLIDFLAASLTQAPVGGADRAAVLSVVRTLLRQSETSDIDDSDYDDSYDEDEDEDEGFDCEQQNDNIAMVELGTYLSDKTLLPELADCMLASAERRTYHIDLPDDPATNVPFSVIPSHDKARLKMVKEIGLLKLAYQLAPLDYAPDTFGNECDVRDLELLCQLAVRATGCSEAFMTIMGVKHNHILAATHPGFCHAAVPREQTMCQHTILTSKPFVAAHPEADVRFHQIEAVKNLRIRYYVGFPVTVAMSDDSTSPSEMPVGTLCCIDSKARRARDTHSHVDFESLAAGPGKGGPWQRVEIADRFVVFRRQDSKTGGNQDDEEGVDANEKTGTGPEVLCAGRLDASIEEVASVLGSTTEAEHQKAMAGLYAKRFIFGSVERSVPCTTDDNTENDLSITRDSSEHLTVKTSSFGRTALFAPNEQWCYLDFFQSKHEFDFLAASLDRLPVGSPERSNMITVVRALLKNNGNQEENNVDNDDGICAEEQDASDALARVEEFLADERNFPPLETCPMMLIHPEADVRLQAIDTIKKMAFKTYVGFPITVPITDEPGSEQIAVGTLCCLDFNAHAEVTWSQYTTLQNLARTASCLLLQKGLQIQQQAASTS